MILSDSTAIIGAKAGAVCQAAYNIKRDLDKVFKKNGRSGGNIVLWDVSAADGQSLPPECFCLSVSDGQLLVCAADDLGFIYGLYEISRSLLGVRDFWFWNDQRFEKMDEIVVPEDYCFCSKPAAVKNRGWFINDEVLIHGWRVNCRVEEPWEMAFEALLRCGGNMVIPGTDRNAERYRELAASMGIAITHHHAEPLGAEMFTRAYPSLIPSYAQYPEKFQKLWQEAIERQKGMGVVWNLGFRGQGDRPFWDDDPAYATGEARGELVSSLIKIQYDMVKKAYPEAVCCTNLYGETMELYNDGYLELPEDVIKIWADNGYGKMVTRRQGNHNPRVSALPKARGGQNGSHGIYYHVSFYDLQAANHITMLQNSADFVRTELKQVLGLGMDDYWIVNCSNIKPHVYFLDLIASMWRDSDVDVAEHRRRYAALYYGESFADLVAESIREYSDYAPVYGPNSDDHAGEQYANHVARVLISQFMRDKNERCEELAWATHKTDLRGQIGEYRNICERAVSGYEEYAARCEAVAAQMFRDGKASADARELYRDSLLLQSGIHLHCYTGACHVCRSLLLAMDQDYKRAFYEAGVARSQYLKANQAMRDREHGKWHNFYENECLTDVKQTAWVLAGLMSYLRNLGDGPHFYEWQKEFLYPEKDRRIMLILNMENHMEDQKLFELMEEKWGR